MKIGHRFQGVSGDFDSSTGELICVQNKKYGSVNLCFRENMNVPFASIRLHSSDLAMDADAVFPDAARLGEEIARRWNSATDAGISTKH